ncbi:Hsp70 family protein [Arthrobacter sp. FW306-07-I]|uniref:Hsp70 family protein n=1 Tax=Arthrobacter sp. FW306-07-I TaxID=2879622 RepID=UPI001F2EFC2B|nr:Hsp70 family protein [Arthrobacter sp. FW306-07-I]UKA77528.1 Hsp70 family protein [Arthrobacter sp. FW306-07-I]
MSYALAVDVGTSFTAAAVVRFHQGASPVPECLPLGARGASVPSVLYYPEEGTVLVGEAAERRGLDTPERVVREFKRRIGDDVPIILGSLALQPEDVFATMARWVADRAAEREGGPASAFFLTHPAAWGSHRLSVVRDALSSHGLENVTLLPEPEAAALHYASQVRVEEGSTIAVYDLGGGTFDTAVLRKSGSSRFELVGRPEGIEDLGGADFDAAVFRYVAGHSGNALDSLDATDPVVLGALTRLRRECVEAKEALSADSEASIPVLLPGVQQQVRLVRSEFEALIEEPVRETVAALEHSLAQLHLEPEDLSTVLLIGGSSRIPLVAQLVSEQLGRPIAVDADPKSSICLGAAVAALLAHTAAAKASASAEAEAVETEAALAGPGSSGADADEARAAVVPSGAPPGTGHPGRPSWSRKYSTAGGAIAAPSRSALHGKGGAHAPKPTVRVTAVAAAAAVLTVLTATAAQSPDGFGSLTAMFVPQAGASTTGGSTGGGTTEAPDPGGAAVVAVPHPLAGVEASATKPLSQEPGPAAYAPPAGKPASSGDGNAPGGAKAGGPAAGAPLTTLSGSGAAGTGIIPDSIATVTASPTDLSQPLPTSPATSVPASPATTAAGTTTSPPTSPAPSSSGTASPGTSPGVTSSPTLSPTLNSGPVPTDTGTATPTSESASPSMTPATMSAAGPTGDALVTPTATELTPTPAVAPAPTPEEITTASTETAVATATTTAPAA